VSSICDQLATFIEVVDAAFNKLALGQKSQVFVQVRAPGQGGQEKQRPKGTPDRCGALAVLWHGGGRALGLNGTLRPPLDPAPRQASLFRLYELAALATAAAGDDQPRLVELLAALAGEVAPGSEEHVYWARRYRLGRGRRCGGRRRGARAAAAPAASVRALPPVHAPRHPTPPHPTPPHPTPPHPTPPHPTPPRLRDARAVIEDTEGDEGRFDGALRQADQACYAAHTARYGVLPKPLYRRLLAAADAAEAWGGDGDEGEGAA
jgi:hypothetical protein